MGCCTTKEDHQNIPADQKPLPREGQQQIEGRGVDKEPPEESDVLLVESPWEEDETENSKPASGLSTSAPSKSVETQQPNYNNVFPYQETAPSQTKSAPKANPQLEQHEVIHKGTPEQKTLAEDKAFRDAMGTGNEEEQAGAVDNATMEAMRTKILQLGEEKAQETGQASAGPAKKMESPSSTQDLAHGANGHQIQQVSVEERPDGHAMFITSVAQPNVIQSNISHKGPEMFVKSVTGRVENTSHEGYELYLQSAAHNAAQNLAVPKGTELFAKSITGGAESAPPDPQEMFLQSSAQPEVVQVLAPHKGPEMFVKSVMGEVENASREGHELYLQSAAQPNATQDLVVSKGAELFAKSVGEAGTVISREPHDVFLSSAVQPVVASLKGAEMFVKSVTEEAESAPKAAPEMYLSSTVQAVVESTPLKGPDMFLKSLSTQVEPPKDADGVFLKSANQPEVLASNQPLAADNSEAAPKDGHEVCLESLTQGPIASAGDSVRMHVDSTQAENSLGDGDSASPAPSPITSQNVAPEKGSTNTSTGGQQTGTPRHAKGRKKGGRGQNGSNRSR